MVLSKSPSKYFLPGMFVCLLIVWVFGLSLKEDLEGKHCSKRFDSSSTDQGNKVYDKDEEELKKKKLKVCVIVLNHDYQYQILVPFTMTLDGVTLEYEVTYVYAENDNIPPHPPTEDEEVKCQKHRYLVYPSRVKYGDILWKVWFGFEYFYKRSDDCGICDFVVKKDSDTITNWFLLSYILINSSPNEWIGRYAKNQKAQRNPGWKWDGTYYIDYIMRKTKIDNRFTHFMNQLSFPPFMHGVTYAFGSELFECVMKKGYRLIEEEENDTEKWINFRMEDVAIGYLIGLVCENRVVNNLDEAFYSEGCGKYKSWKGMISIHKNCHFDNQSCQPHTEYPYWENI